MATTDTSIHNAASGRAADTVARHAPPAPLRFYSGWFCPFAQRAWIVLCEKRIPHQYVEINPYKKDATFLAVNPRGLVPAIALPPAPEGPERVLYESLVVCEYLDEAYSDAEKYRAPLLPEDSYDRARCRLWIDHINTRIVPAFYKFLQHTPEKPYTLEEVRSEFAGHVRTFATELSPRGPWFLGDRFSLVDVALAPWAKRLFLIDHYKQGGVGLPTEGDSDAESRIWAKWRVWLEAITQRESILDTSSDEDRFIEVYKRYADDTTQSLVGQATRQGKKVLP
jgi:glutathione S-transferase